MPELLDPLWVSPRLIERIWGRTELGDWIQHSKTMPDCLIGEAWLTDITCEVEGGSTFGSRLDVDRQRMLGTATAPPLLVKLLFTSAPLSVQVHPTDASALADGRTVSGKDEAWHVLEAALDAVVWVGFEASVSEAALRAAVADGSVLSLMNRCVVRRGDTVSVPAGTVHAIGAGLVLLEIQDPVDVTYRLYDYGRPRPLQLEQSLAVAHLCATNSGAAHVQATGATRSLLATAPRFVVETCGIGSGLMVRPDGTRYHIFVPLAPGIVLNSSPMLKGAAVFLPAAGHPVVLGGPKEALIAILHPGPELTPCLAGVALSVGE